MKKYLKICEFVANSYFKSSLRQNDAIKYTCRYCKTMFIFIACSDEHWDGFFIAHANRQGRSNGSKWINLPRGICLGEIPLDKVSMPMPVAMPMAMPMVWNRKSTKFETKMVHVDWAIHVRFTTITNRKGTIRTGLCLRKEETNLELARQEAFHEIAHLLLVVDDLTRVQLLALGVPGHADLRIRALPERLQEVNFKLVNRHRLQTILRRVRVLTAGPATPFLLPLPVAGVAWRMVPTAAGGRGARRLRRGPSAFRRILIGIQGMLIHNSAMKPVIVMMKVVPFMSPRTGRNTS